MQQGNLTGSIFVILCRRSASLVAVHDFVFRCDSDIPKPVKAAQTDAPASIDGVYSKNLSSVERWKLMNEGVKTSLHSYVH